MKYHTTSIRLYAEALNIIKGEIESGRARSLSDAVHQGLRLLRDKQQKEGGSNDSTVNQ